MTDDVIAAARTFAAVQAEWRAELDQDHVITPAVARRRAHAVEGLMAAVAALEASDG